MSLVIVAGDWLKYTWSLQARGLAGYLCAARLALCMLLCWPICLWGSALRSESSRVPRGNGHACSPVLNCA